MVHYSMGDIAKDSDIEEEFHAVLDKIKTEDIKTEPDSEFSNSYGNETKIIITDDDRRSERPPQVSRAQKSKPWRATNKRPGKKTAAENLNLNRSTAPKTYTGPKSKEPKILPKDIAKPSTLCRLCATRSFVTVSIFGKHKNIVQKIENCLSVVVKRTDTLPQRVCRECLEKLEFCNNFHESVARAEKQLTILDNRRSDRSPTVKEEEQILDPIIEEINVSRRGLDNRLKRKRICEEITKVSPSDDNFLSNLRLDWDELIPVQSDVDVFDQSSELFYDPPKIKLGRKRRFQLREMLNSSEKLRVNPGQIVRTYRARHKPRREANEENVIICGDEVSTKCRFCGVSFHTTNKRYVHEKAHISTNFYPCWMCKRSFDSEEKWSDHRKESEKNCERKKSVVLSNCNESEKRFLAELRTKFQNIKQNEEPEVKEEREIRDQEEHINKNLEELEPHEKDHVENRYALRTPKAKECGYTCGHCGQVFARKSTMWMHVKNHVGKKKKATPRISKSSITRDNFGFFN